MKDPIIKAIKFKNDRKTIRLLKKHYGNNVIGKVEEAILPIKTNEEDYQVIYFAHENDFIVQTGNGHIYPLKPQSGIEQFGV